MFFGKKKWQIFKYTMSLISPASRCVVHKFSINLYEHKQCKQASNLQFLEQIV